MDDDQFIDSIMPILFSCMGKPLVEWYNVKTTFLYYHFAVAITRHGWCKDLGIFLAKRWHCAAIFGKIDEKKEQQEITQIMNILFF